MYKTSPKILSDSPFLKKKKYSQMLPKRKFLGPLFFSLSKPNRKKVIPVLVVYEFLNLKKRGIAKY
jgi:hypothetical protein